MADARLNDMDQELFSELTKPLAQPLLIHVVSPFADGKDPNYCLQNNVLWEWRTLEGNLKKLFLPQSKIGFICDYVVGMFLSLPPPPFPSSLPLLILTIFRPLTKYLEEWWSFCDYVQSFFFLLCGDGESE